MLPIRSLFIAFPIFIMALLSGKTGMAQYKISAEAFKNKIETTSNAQLIDVRTAQEFKSGHLKDAINMDWNKLDFEKQVSTLDKTRPVFVYCLSGGRSAYAAESMRSHGFKEVYELEGGIMKWRSAGYPEAGKTTEGMSEQQYNNLLNTDKTVLIDFYAIWCAPCKKMMPIIDEIAKDNIGKLLVVRINTDENQRMVKILKIDDLPTQLIYKNGKIMWRHSGFAGKEYLLKELKL